MQFIKSLPFAVDGLMASLFSANSALATVQSFSANTCPASTSMVQGNFTVSNPGGFCGPFQNGGLGGDQYPSTTTITANGFVFDAFSIGVGGVNSAIPTETEIFIGDLEGGGTIIQSFDFQGNSVNFVTANLVGFDKLIDLRANVGAVTLQDLTYENSAILEPGTFGLIGLCFAAAIACRRKCARQSG